MVSRVEIVRVRISPREMYTHTHTHTHRYAASFSILLSCVHLPLFVHLFFPRSCSFVTPRTQVFRKQIKDIETGRRQPLHTTYPRSEERERERERRSGTSWVIAVKTVLFRACHYFEPDSTNARTKERLCGAMVVFPRRHPRL